MPWYNWIINHFCSFWWDYVAPLLLLDTQPLDGISCHTLQLKKWQITSSRFPTFSLGTGLWEGMPGILNHVKRFLPHSERGRKPSVAAAKCMWANGTLCGWPHLQTESRSFPVIRLSQQCPPAHFGNQTIRIRLDKHEQSDRAKSFMIRWLNCLFPHRNWKQHRKLQTDPKQMNKACCIMPFQSYCWL